MLAGIDTGRERNVGRDQEPVSVIPSAMHDVKRITDSDGSDFHWLRLFIGFLLMLTIVAAISCSNPTEPNSPPSLRVIWSRPSTWPYLGTPAAVNGAAYLEMEHHNLSKIELDAGAELWKVPLPEPSLHRSPSMFEGTLYLATTNSNACALDTASGNVLWSSYVFPPDSVSSGGIHVEYELSSSVVDVSRVYFASQDGSVYCLNRSTGAMEWRHILGATCVAKPLLAEGMLFVAGFDSTLRALDPETGSQEWSMSLNEAVEYTSPQQLGKNIYIGGTEGTVFCVGAEDGHVRWKRSNLGRIRAGLSVSEDALCVGTAQYLYALEPASGRVLWKDASIGHNPVQEAGRVYFLPASGEFTIYDAGTGQILTKSMLDPGTLWTAPVVLDDRVLVPAYGVLHCVAKDVGTP